MQLRILSSAIDLPPETRDAIERQVRLVVGRYSATIVRLQVTVGAGTAEPVASRCRIRADLGRGETLTAVEDDADPVAAAVGAARRVQRRLRQRPNLARPSGLRR